MCIDLHCIHPAPQNTRAPLHAGPAGGAAAPSRQQRDLEVRKHSLSEPSLGGSWGPKAVGLRNGMIYGIMILGGFRFSDNWGSPSYHPLKI